MGKESIMTTLKMEKIIKAISKSSMIHSLETFNIFYCDVDATTVKSLLEKYGMENVKVVEENNNLSSD